MPLMQSGLTSLGALKVGRRMKSTFSFEVPATLVFDYPTVNAIASLVQEKTQSEAPLSLVAAVSNDVASTDRTSKNVRIAGMSFNMPFCLRSQKSLRETVVRGQSIPMSVPLSRWDASAYNLNASASYGSFRTIELHYCGLSPREASSVDPQQLMLLEEAASGGP